MKIKQITTEANIAQQIFKDPKMTKMLNIAFRHDPSLPLSQISRLGPKPTDKQIVELWADIVDRSLADTIYGNLALLNKFEPWLLKLYINGVVDWEIINGEGGDTLGAWNALSIRGMLEPQHQDFNRFQSIDQLTRALRGYGEILKKIKDQTALEKHKRDRQEIVLIDNERFYVAIPLNYGSCYTFNNDVGVQANFCTGGSSGLNWFKQYSVDGPIIIVFDKANSDKDEGKWQIHTASDQLVDAKQKWRYSLSYNAERFTTFFPGLLEVIISVISARAEEIHEASKAIVKTGYDIGKEIARLRLVNTHKPDQPGGNVIESPDAERLYQQNLIREVHDQLVEMQARYRRQNKDVMEARSNPEQNTRSDSEKYDLTKAKAGGDMWYKWCRDAQHVIGEQVISEGARIARKAGQPASSKKHSDLYTDENPKGTITGLKFATVEDARASVSKIRNSGRSHAHKIQAAVAMEQRARVVGKTEAASVYRKFINSMKKKTKKESIDEACWKGYHKEGMKKMFGKKYPNCVKNTNEEQLIEEDTDIPFNTCPGCGGNIVHESQLQEKQDACYHKVKSRYKVWPSAYASGALVQCRKKGAKNWGNKSESIQENKIYFSIPKSLENFTELTESFHLNQDKKGWYLNTYQTNFKKSYRNAIQAFSIL